PNPTLTLFFFNDTPTPEIYTLSLHDALPIFRFKALAEEWQRLGREFAGLAFGNQLGVTIGAYVKDLELIAKATDPPDWRNVVQQDRKSTRLNSSHVSISYAVFCLKKKKLSNY